jgi:hypothetical protein
MSRKILGSSRSLKARSLFLGCALAASFWFLAEGRAAAQTRLGDKGQLVISAENLFSWANERVGRSLASGDQSDTSTRFGFLYSGSREAGTVTPLGPQVGGHYFVIPNLSIGGTIGYEARGGSRTQSLAAGTASRTDDAADESTFVLLPKVGYTLMLNNMLGFWFRGGLGIAHVGLSGPGNNTKVGHTFWLLSLDALFVVSPVQHFGFYAGPQANLSFAGSFSITDQNGTETSVSSSFRSIGIGFGLFGYFDLM